MADFSLTQQELDAILRGEATAGDLLGARQAQAQGGMEGLSPAAQQYLATFGGGGDDYLGQAASQYSQIPGIEDVKPGYKADDLLAYAKYNAGQAQAGGKAGYQTWMDQQNLDLKQQAATAKFSSPDADLVALQLRGVTPEKLNAALNSGSKDDIDWLMETLGAVDKNGLPDYNPANIQRLAHLDQHWENRQSELAQQDEDQRKRTRLQSLSPENRAKEAYLQMQNPGQKVVVNPDGMTYLGPDAEAKAQEALTKGKQVSTYQAGPERAPAGTKTTWPKPKQEARSLRSDIANTKGPIGKAVGLSPPVLFNKGINKVADVAPGAARAAWRYLSG